MSRMTEQVVAWTAKKSGVNGYRVSCTSRVIVGLVAYQVQEDKVGFCFEGITLILAFLAFEEAFL